MKCVGNTRQKVRMAYRPRTRRSKPCYSVCHGLLFTLAFFASKRAFRHRWRLQSLKPNLAYGVDHPLEMEEVVARIDTGLLRADQAQDLGQKEGEIDA